MPSEYVTELADQAFREISSGVGDEIEKVLAWRPPDAPSLANRLNSRPDLQAQIASLTGYTPSRWMLEHELGHVDARRRNLGMSPISPDGGPYKRAAESGLTGLCFSGGGIRSATFNLGILQGLAELKLLRCFDYLSTVSGGGYIHQWFAAWTKRRDFQEVEKQLISLPEPGNPGAHPAPVRWLRRYSNYLTPETGLLSADTWVAFAIWLRNTLLNQIILISGLLLLALLLRGISSAAIIPQHNQSAAAFAGIIFYLSLVAITFVGRSLCGFREPRAFGQGKAQLWLVAPMMASALLTTLLFPLMAANAFAVHLLLSFFGSMLVLLALALTITFAAGAPLCHLKSHHRTAQYNSVAAFWREKPKCFSHLKFVIAVFGFIGVSVLSAAGGAAWILGSFLLFAKLWSVTSHYWWRVVLIIGPALILGGPLVTMLLVVGLLGRTLEDARREWLSRLAAWMGLYILLWISSFTLSQLGYDIVTWLWKRLWAGVPALAGWALASIGGLLAGNSSTSSGAKSFDAPEPSAIERLAVIGPYVFIAGLLLLISTVAEIVLRRAAAHGSFVLIAVHLAVLAICTLFAWKVDINEFSLHAFYRNRLARCYLGASNIPRHANPFTGFDETDSNIAVSDLVPAKGFNGPFPIFCTALNLTFGEDLAWQERKAASFAFTPLYSGYDISWTAAKGSTDLRFNGFVRTESYAYPEPGVHINTAAAISGAAVSPNMGYHTSPATAFLMTLFSVRLGWWLRNPRVLNEDGSKRNAPDSYPSPSPRFSFLWLVNELLARANDTNNYVYLSDGGHFDNMGLYELVRRRCPYIVICDSEDDGDLKFGGIGMAIRRCRVDFGVEIALDLRPLEHVGETPYSSAHGVVGTIRYPEDPGTPGTVVYIKSSLTGDEPGDVLNYKKQHSAFPHDTTLNQWFTESQFESYRRLGQHVAFSVFEPAGPRELNCTDLDGRSRYFSNLRHIWCAPTPEMERFASAHAERYEALLTRVRTDSNLPGFFDMLFVAGKGEWKTGRSAEQVNYAVPFSSELIEFMWIIFTDLNLVFPEKRNHPHARGWCLMFKEWSKIDVIREGWLRYQGTYSQRFRNFAQSDDIGLPGK